jgi:protein-S-isoprenylcysteine O-methyltransferase Ste14
MKLSGVFAPASMTPGAASKMSTITYTSHSWPGVMQLFGGMWFLLLALLVAWSASLKVEAATALIDILPSVTSSCFLASFYVIIGVMVMTRPRAKARATGVLPKLAAFAGTYMPWSITFFSKTDAALPNLISAACVMIGTIMMLVSISHLGRSFSLVPQARAVVRSGPYRWIRHPLYLAEEIAILGVVFQYLSSMAVAILVMHVSIQVCRIYYEEDLLCKTCPEYSPYAADSWRAIPHVW